MKPTWKIFTALAGIFVAGVVTGAFVGEPLMRKLAPKPSFVPDLLKKYTEQLDLSAEQQAAIHPIIKKTAEDLRGVHRGAFKAAGVILDRMETSVSAQLTGAQRVRFLEIQAKERERRRQWMAERDKLRAEPPPPGPAGGDPRPVPPPSGPENAGVVIEFRAARLVLGRIWARGLLRGASSRTTFIFRLWRGSLPRSLRATPLGRGMARRGENGRTPFHDRRARPRHGGGEGRRGGVGRIVAGAGE